MDSTITDIGRIYLRWALSEGIGPIVFTRLVNHFGDAEKPLGASPARLEEVHGIGRGKSSAIAHSRDTADVEGEIEAAARHDVRIICRADGDYPPGLREIPDAPVVLFVKGELRETDTVAVAIVGTRRCTIYGSEQARRFGELLSGAGFTVISGLARGIDAFAHHGAVDAGGRSIAVMGNGLAEVYPPENRVLAERLLEHGAWVSELPIRSAVRKENFPSRNRVIAGMSLATLVVEAPTRSGALITGRLANDYNREVFAIPGRLQEPASTGTNALIRDGIAKLVTSLDDMLDELGDVGYRMRLERDGPATPVHADERHQQPGAAATHEARPGSNPARGDAPDRAGSSSRDGSRRRAVSANAPLSTAEKRVYEVVGFDPLLQDVIIQAAELPPGEVLAACTSLELKGLVKRLPGNLIVRAARA